jgi:hypothetical protein
VVTVEPERVARLAKALAQRRRLLAQAVSGHALQETVEYAARESALSFWVLTTTGRVVATDTGPLPTTHVDAITAEALAAARLPAVATTPDDHVAYTVFDVERSSRRPLARRVIAVAGSADGWPTAAVDAISQLAAIAALDLARHVSDHNARRAVVDAAFGLLGADEAGRAGVYLRQLGVNLEAPAVVVAAGLTRQSRPDDEVRRVLEDAIVGIDGIEGIAAPIVGAGGSHEVLALIQPPVAGGDAALLDSLSQSLRRIGPGLRRGDRLTVGVSMDATVASLGGAVRAARFARQLAGDTGQPVQVVCEADLRSVRLLLNAVPDVLRTTFADRVLGPVLTYDDRGAGDLIPTLAAFFACNGSWSRTADRLGLHINTVRYRIARIEQLTGRAVGRADDWMDLYAALTLLRPAG